MIITSNTANKIKALHGVDCAPYSSTGHKEQPMIKQMFGLGKFPHCRLHDCCGSYGGTYFVDIPNIFPDFDADETKEENYDFYFTDEYITAVIESGAQIVYRLGVTIEWASKKYRIHPPKDFNKWARICEHVIMHYNKGWANGFRYNIEYWEIWNEPENPSSMWTGTKEQFFDLYKTASKHLKGKFPEIKIGGYGSCGFYAAFRPNMSDFYKGFLTYFTDFLKMVKENDCPLDFYTWHIYTNDVTEIAKSAEYARKTLDEYGFYNTESHLNEWNYGAEGGGFDNMETLYGAAFIASALIEMQRLPVDLAQYYCISINGRYNGLINLRTLEYSPVMYVMSAFGELFELGKELKIERNDNEAYALGATDGNKTTVLVSCYEKKSKTVEIQAASNAGVSVLRNGGFEKINAEFNGNVIKLPAENNEVYVIRY